MKFTALILICQSCHFCISISVDRYISTKKSKKFLFQKDPGSSGRGIQHGFPLEPRTPTDIKKIQTEKVIRRDDYPMSCHLTAPTEMMIVDTCTYRHVHILWRMWPKWICSTVDIFLSFALAKYLARDPHSHKVKFLRRQMWRNL